MKRITPLTMMPHQIKIRAFAYRNQPPELANRLSQTPLLTPVLIFVITICVLTSTFACEYSKYGLEAGDSSQTDLSALFGGRYQEERKTWKTNEWRAEVSSLESQGAASSAEIEPRLNHAWALHMAGQNPKSSAAYQAILKAFPGNYEALCSYATLLQEMKQYAAARDHLSKAISQKPGFRSQAEEYHLAMIEFQEKSQRNYNFAKEHIFLEPLTAIWKNRKSAEQNLSKVSFPEGYNSKGMVELMRQFPNYGEGWFVLGMLLEHEEDFSMAAKAYDRALEKGSAHAPEIRSYMATFREYGRSHDPGRLAGRRFVQMLAAFVGLFIAYKLLQVVSRVVNDITGAKAQKQEEARRKRMKFKDPDSPL